MLLDQCPKEPFEVVKAIVEEQLGCHLAVVFNDFNPEAVAAASIGQVHFATRTPVAVKVQYSTVKRYFQMDVRTIEFILRWQGMGQKVKDIVQGVEEQFKNELDYTKEAGVMREIHGNVMPHFGKQVVVPLPIDSMHHFCQEPCSTRPASMCTREVMTMERLNGNLVREHTAKLLEVFAEHRSMDLAGAENFLEKTSR